jgi:serine/threonine protein kinase
VRYCQVCHRCFNDGIAFCLFDHLPTCEVERLPILVDGKYRLEQLIAHGGMGSVYRATHLQLDRPVAIKILRPEFLTDAKVVERFNREARAAARLKHPNIIAVYDFGVLPADGGAYLVMEFIAGRSLREEMRLQTARHGQMRCERAVSLIQQACAGIEAAHQHGIIHRDLKPDNIMIETDLQGNETAKVLDFGIAKLKEKGQTLQSLTDEGVFIGTPNYIAPEQCLGQAVDGRADIYSLGIILYELLTGRTPFGSSSTANVLLRHLQELPAPPRRFRPDLSEALERVILRALAKSPGQRFSSCAQFAEELIRAVPVTRDQKEAAVIDKRNSSLAPRQGAVEPETVTANLKAPAQAASLPLAWEGHLLPESPSQPRFYFFLIATALALLGAVMYWQQRTDGAANLRLASASGEFSSPHSATSRAEKTAQQMKALISTVPAALGTSAVTSVANPEFERVKGELLAIYAAWARTASQGQWRAHMSFYADQVDYYRDGLISRSAIAARKRRTFSGLDSFSLFMDEQPIIRPSRRDGRLQADLIFDKQWQLRRGRKRAEGKSRMMLTLRRDDQSWHIVRERQLRLYYSRTQTVK